MISACMIVQDEEECIARCLDSIHDYVDEIVVIDGGSIDRTKEIVLQYPKVNLYEIPFEKDFGKQRNNAIEKANGDWIFIIDADEYCYPYVIQELQFLTTQDSDAYKFTRKTLINGYLVNRFSLDYTFRFFKSYCRYSGSIHEDIIGFRKCTETNLEMIHDKKSEWQLKDDKLYWDMGQEPTAGWGKIGDRWEKVEDLTINTVTTQPDNSLSALLCIYNEELMLRGCLSNLVKFVDEIIIVDGSPIGASNDGSIEIINEFMQNHLMIKYYSGIFAFEDATWDEPSQINFGLSKVTKGYVMRTHPDTIYDIADMEFLRQALTSGKKYIYCSTLDFWGDTSHILLYRHSNIETSLMHQLTLEPLAVSMNCDVRAESIRISDSEPRRFGMAYNIDYDNDILYLPHVKKYHFGFIKPIRIQIEKYVCYAKRGDMGSEYMNSDLPTLYEFAIKHVLDGYRDKKGMEYYGYYPEDARSLKNISYMDGYEEFIEWYGSNFNEPEIDLAYVKQLAEKYAWQWQGQKAFGKDFRLSPPENRILCVIKTFGWKPSVLDIGCANAVPIVYYKKNNTADRIVGIDISENGIGFAKETCLNNDVTLELYATPIEEYEDLEKFDVIRMTEVIEHVVDISKVLKKISSLLSDNGIFIGTAPCDHICDAEVHLHYFCGDDLKNLLSEYFDVMVYDIMDFTGEGENHFFFQCRRKS